MPTIRPSNHYLAELEAREQSGHPIRVAIIGTGAYGETLVAQLCHIPGMHPAIVCDLDLERATQAYTLGGYAAEQVAHTSTLSAVKQCVVKGRPAIADDLDLALRAPVDVVVDCTGDPETGCQVAWGAIREGKHVVMVNVEADVTAGTHLAQRARRAGQVYTLADGDQPSLIVGLVDWARCLGLEVVSAGKWTVRYPPQIAAARLATYAHPTKSDVTYLDGSKTQIEMASAANACGLGIDTPGLHGRPLCLEEMPVTLRPRSAGGILGQSAVVEYVNNYAPEGDHCAPEGQILEPRLGGGVWAVITSEAQRGLEAMAHKGVVVSPDGTHAVLYRPNHLVGVETPWSILKAVLEGLPTATPGPEANVEVIAISKIDLCAGEPLGGLGTADVRGIAVEAKGAAERGELPVGLAAGVRLKNDVPAGTRLTFDMVQAHPDSRAWMLRTEKKP